MKTLSEGDTYKTAGNSQLKWKVIRRRKNALLAKNVSMLSGERYQAFRPRLNKELSAEEPPKRLDGEFPDSLTTASFSHAVDHFYAMSNWCPIQKKIVRL